MELWLSLDKDFEKVFKEMEKEYPEFIKMEGLANNKLDPTRFFKGFIKSGNVADASIDPNSNVNSQAIPSLLRESSKPLQKLLSFNKIFIEMKELFDVKTAEEFFKAHILGDIYLHDATSTSFYDYCFAYSVKDIAEKGLFFINEMKAEPAQHLDTFNSHIIESVAFLTNLQAGAVGLPDYLLYSYYFYKKDLDSGYIPKENAEKIKTQQFQKVIFELNQPFLKQQAESAYTNFSILDREYFKGLFDGLKMPDGSNAIDYLEGFMQYQKDFMNYVNKLREEKTFTFPVLTYSTIFRDGYWADEEMSKFIIKHNMKWGDTNIYVSKNADVLSSCCRANFDISKINQSNDFSLSVKNKPEKLRGNFNSTGGSDLNIGSTKVVTINLGRIGFISKDFEEAKARVKYLVELIQKFHYAHRNILKKNIERGLLPSYSYGLKSLEKQYATVGINGVQEFIEFLGGIDKNEIDEKFYNDKGIEMAKDILDYINKLGEDTLEKYGYTQNLEQVPAENASPKLIRKDRMLLKGFNLDKPTYSNQWCGLDDNFSISERIRISGILDQYTGGGQILHLNLGEDWGSFEDAWRFNTEIAKAGVVYWSEIRKFQYCENDHNFFGKFCPVCKKEAKGDIIKIVGYLTKNEYYQKERREELEKRKFYSKKDLTK